MVIFAPHWTEVAVAYYLGTWPNTVGFPMKALSERRRGIEALERDRRTPEELRRLLEQHLDARGGNVVLVRLLADWEADAGTLENVLEANYQHQADAIFKPLRLIKYQRRPQTGNQRKGTP